MTEEEIKKQIGQFLGSVSVADHLGDVRNSEVYLWNALGVQSEELRDAQFETDGAPVALIVEGQEYVIAQQQDHEGLLYFDHPDGSPVTAADSDARVWWGVNHFRLKDEHCPKCAAPVEECTGHVLNDRISAWSCNNCGHVWPRVHDHTTKRALGRAQEFVDQQKGSE